MTKEYIKREAVLKALASEHKLWSAFEDSYEIVQSVPASDVEEVVHCKDCKHHNKFSCAMSSLKYPKQNDDNGYCHLGERRTYEKDNRE